MKKYSKKSPAKTDKKGESKLPDELVKLEGIVGQFMEYWGFKKIHGRIWTHLYTSKKPLDSIELMARLQVSKGLMSLAVRELIEYEVILSDHIGRHGTTFYVANPDLIGVISNVLKIRETKILQDAEAAAEKLHKLNTTTLNKFDLSDERIQNIVDMTRSAQMLLSTFLVQDTSRPLTQTFIPEEIYNLK